MPQPDSTAPDRHCQQPEPASHTPAGEDAGFEFGILSFLGFRVVSGCWSSAVRSTWNVVLQVRNSGLRFRVNVVGTMLALNILALNFSVVTTLSPLDTASGP